MKCTTSFFLSSLYEFFFIHVARCLKWISYSWLNVSIDWTQFKMDAKVYAPARPVGIASNDSHTQNGFTMLSEIIRLKFTMNKKPTLQSINEHMLFAIANAIDHANKFHSSHRRFVCCYCFFLLDLILLFFCSLLLIFWCASVSTFAVQSKKVNMPWENIHTQ